MLWMPKARLGGFQTAFQSSFRIRSASVRGMPALFHQDVDAAKLFGSHREGILDGIVRGKVEPTT